MATARTPAVRDRVNQRLFCYGTLQIPAVLEAVIARRPRGVRAFLNGYGAYQVRGAEYPGLLRCSGQKTWGMLYQDLTPMELRVLDRFEGYLYQRRPQIVVKDNGQRVRAWVYRMAAGQTKQLTGTPWRLARFMRTVYHRFMQRFVMDRRALYEQKTD